MKQPMQRITDPAALSELKSLATALVFLKPLDPVFIDTSYFSDAEREKFKQALVDLGEAIRESRKLSQRGKEEQLIARIGLACNAYSRALIIHPWATKHRLGRKRIAKGQKARSTKREEGRKLVYEHLDQFFSEDPDWLNEAYDAIAKEIHGAIEKKLKGMSEKERPHLGRTTLRNHVGEYLRRRRVK